MTVWSRPAAAANRITEGKNVSDSAELLIIQLEWGGDSS